MDFAGKHVLVLGLGETGMAMAQWLLRCGARLRVADTRNAPERMPALQQLDAGIVFVGGEFQEELLDGIDLVAVSPGLLPTRELAALLPAAQQRNIPFWGEMEIFAQALAALKAQRGYAPKLIAITGTNGKTTVTSLVGLLCQRAGLRTKIAGNISPAVLDVLRVAMDSGGIQLNASAVEPEVSAPQLEPSEQPQPAIEAVVEAAQDEALIDVTVEAVDAVASEDEGEAESSVEPGKEAGAAAAASEPAFDNSALPQVWVLELSSFQLHTTYSLAPNAAAVLNVTQDHLDWHGDMAAYAADKARIFGTGTVQVLNRDDAIVMGMAKPMAQVFSFGTGAPEHAGDFGLLNEHGMLWLAAASTPEEGQPTGRRKKKDAEEVPAAIARLMPADALKIRGQHNAANALAALALCRAIGLSFAPLLHGLRDYKGEPHRVELVAKVAGVDYIDDSKGTNVGATVAALKGIGQESAAETGARRVILIAGGEGKGQDFSPLTGAVERYAKAVLLIGKAAPDIRSAIQVSGVDLQDCASLEAAVQAAADMAREGDMVLLSPACASFDMFRNYAHRAQVFVDAVRELGLARGEVL